MDFGLCGFMVRGFVMLGGEVAGFFTGSVVSFFKFSDLRRWLF